MKITLREKLLAVGLGLFVLIFGFYQFIFQPQVQAIALLNNQVLDNDKQIKVINDFLKPGSKLTQDYKIMKVKTDEQTRMFFPLDDQEKTILGFDQMLTSTALNGLSVSFSNPQLSKTINTAKQTEAMKYNLKDLVEDAGKVSTENKATVPSPSNDKNQIPSMDLTLQYSGTYANLLSFLSTVEGWEKKTFVKSILIGPNKNAEGISGNIVFRLFMLPKYPSSDSDFRSWDIKGTYGSADPFVFIGKAASSVPTVTKGVTAPVTTDFVMSMKPVTADLPAVVFGKSKDYTRASYVYSDDPGYVNTKIKVTKKEGKYYFQYQTQGDLYPKDGSMEVFQPQGQSLTLLIYSTPRNPEHDQNGINLSVINESDLPFVVQVLNDDSAKPRVKVTEQSGNVQIK
ncbi:MAG: hypothetical protein P4L59_15275 [Desulfosporosinus sp.]|nr:hypothetical protein [Desulfosporosinus sp.]